MYVGEQVQENIDSDEENCSNDEQDVGQQPSSKKARKSYSTVHEKYDSFVSYLSTYKEMMDTCVLEW